MRHPNRPMRSFIESFYMMSALNFPSIAKCFSQSKMKKQKTTTKLKRISKRDENQKKKFKKPLNFLLVVCWIDLYIGGHEQLT